MHYAKTISPLVTAFTVVVLATEALATPEEDTTIVRRRHRTSEILAHMDSNRVEGKSWIESHMALRKGVGIVYRYQVKTDDEQKLVFSVGGPVLKKKLLGVQFEVRF